MIDSLARLRFVYIADHLDSSPNVVSHIFDGDGFPAEFHPVSDPALLEATLAGNDWDLVLVEWPVIGLELLAEIKKATQAHPHLVFVALTENPADEVVIRSAKEAIGAELLAWEELPYRLADLIPASRQEGLDREIAQSILQQRARELMALHGISSAAYEAVSENDLYERVTTIIANTIHPSQFGILVMDEPNGKLVLHHTYRGLLEGDPLTEVKLGEGITGRVAVSGQPLNVPDVTQFDGYISGLQPMRSEICLPIKVDATVVGVVNAESTQPHAFSAEDERLLTSLAYQLGLAVGRLRNDEVLRKQAKQLLDIHDASEWIAAASLDLDSVCQAVWNSVSRLLPHDAFVLSRWDRHNHELEIVYSTDDGVRYPGFRVKDDKGWSSYVLHTGVSLKVNDATQENNILAAPVPYGTMKRSRSVLVAPLKLAGRTLGAVSVQSYEPDAFTWDDLRLLELIAGHAAIALENSHLYEEISRQALTFANMFDAVIITDPEQCIADWNPSAERLLGYRRDEALRQNVSLIYPSELRENILADIALGLEGSGRYHGEVGFTRKDGTRGVADLVVVPANGPDGKMLASITLLRDVTLQRKAEEALRVSEARLAGIINSAMDGIITADETGSIFLFNQAAERMFGFSGAEAIGRPLDQLLPGFPNLSDRPYTLAVRKDDRKFPVEVSVSQVSVSGREYLTAIVRDITERVNAQVEMSRLAGVVQQAAETILLTDLDGNILYINPYGEKVSGYSAEEAIGRNPRIFKSGRQSAEFYRELWETLLDGRPWTGVLANRTKNGSLIHENATIFPIKDENGSAIGYAAVKRDISLEVQREREMQAIVSVSTALRKAVSRSEMLPIILEQLINILDAKDGAISFYEQAGDFLRLEMGWGGLSAFGGEIIARGQGVSGLVFDHGGPFQTDNVREVEGYVQVVDSMSSKAVVGASLIAQGEPIGVLWVGRDQPFSASEFRVFQAVVDMSANAIHRASLHERTVRYAEQTVAITTAGRAMAETLNLAQVYSRLAASVNELLPDVQSLGILRVDAKKNVCKMIYALHKGAQLDVSKVPPISLTRLKTDVFARAIRTHEPLVIGSLKTVNFDITRLGFTNGLDGSAMIVPLVARGKVLGVLGLIDKRVNRFSAEEADLMALMGSTAATALENADLYQTLQRSNWELLEAYEQTLEGWSKALDLRDRDTENHTQRVTQMTLDLSRALGIEGEQLVHIRRGAMLHDIGKLGVGDRVLLKTGSLTEEEQGEMRKHPQLAHDMLSPIAYLRSALNIPYCHHEKWNGTGYPRGLKGEEIPLEARIFAIVDVYDALTNKRPYRPAWSHEDALQYIEEQAGKHFDPNLVPVFLSLHKQK